MMKYLLLLTLFSVAITAVPLPSTLPERFRGGSLYRKLVDHHDLAAQLRGHVRNTTVNIFNQLIDHADPKRGTFQQRFWLDYTYWNPNNGPVFLYISGEGPASGSPRGYIVDVARNASALLITLEHRYYGLSLPAPLTDKETLKTLRVEMVMADFGAFMDHIEGAVLQKQNLRWVSVGGSYAGALSAWLKVTYPTRFVASWSSSGVVEAQFDFTAYDGHIVSVLPSDCLQALRNIMGNFTLMYDDPAQRSQLMALFGTPSYFTKDDMTWMIADAVSGGVQYGGKFHMCAQLVPQRSDMLRQYAEYINNTLGSDFGSSCAYSTVCLSDPTMSSQWAAGGYPWIYQSCTELGYWQIGYPGSLRPQSVSTSYFINQCRAMFSPDIISDTFSFNRKWGGLTPNATHVVALQGSDDPFSMAGVRQSMGPLYQEFTAECDTCGHCGDLGTPSASDPANLTKQREFIMTTLLNWLK